MTTQHSTHSLGGVALRNRRGRRSAGLLCLVCAFALHSVNVRCAGFAALAKVTDGARKYQVSRTADNIMAVDGAGRVHLTYWAGGLSTTASSPSFIYYRSWTASGGWDAQQQIDNSDTVDGHIGGRHPSLAMTAGGGVWVLWHDHRNGTAVGNWIDQIEIYGDYLPPSGSFSSTDTRFTTTSAAHSGDTGYTPKIAMAANGVLSVVWFDFNADPSVADIYLKTSDAFGVFNLSEPIASNRMTNAGSRGSVPSYAVPDLAITPDGTRHMVWAGGESSGVNLYYAEAAPGATGVSEVLLASGATDFFDPPHIAASPNGDVWVAWGDDTVVGQEDVLLRRRRAGQPSFDAPVNLTNVSGRQYSVDLKVDGTGRVHLVWLDERAPRHIHYAEYDPASGSLGNEQDLSPTGSNWIRPALALDADGNAYIAVEQIVNPINAGDIWFTTNAPPSAVDPEVWSAYGAGAEGADR